MKIFRIDGPRMGFRGREPLTGGPVLLKVKCVECDWTGRRTAKFFYPLSQRHSFDMKRMYSIAAGRQDAHGGCPRCDESVIFCWPKMRDPKLNPEFGDVLIKGKETRHVTDRTLGGSVLYRTGPQGRGRRQRCNGWQWKVWVQDAVVIEIAEEAEEILV